MIAAEAAPADDYVETGVMADDYVETDALADEAVEPAAPAVEPEKPAKKGGSLIGRTLFSLFCVVLGVAGIFAAASFDLLDPKQVMVDAGLVDNKVIPGPSAKGGTVPGVAAEAPTPQLARQLLETGSPAKAIAVYDKCDQNAPDVLAGRGQAKWLAYLQTCASENKAPARADADSALKDLTEAVAKAKGNEQADLDAARAYLWQGLIAESFDDFAGAEKIYTDAQTELKNEAALTLLRAAKNRLEIVRPAQGAAVGAIAPRHLLLTFTLFLAADPEGAPKTTEPAGQECGFLFWEALLSASKHEYGDAIKKIPLIKAVHARQQLSMAGRGLNPLSDPREQILPVCLDELARSWALADQLYNRPEAKMLVEQKKTAEALAAVFAKSKNSEDALKMIADKLMLKADEKAVDAVQTLITAKTKAEDEKKLADDGKKVADDMLVALGKSLKDAGIDDPKVEDGLKKLITAKADVDGKIKALADSIDKAGVKDPDTAKALTMLIAARDDADAVVKGLRDRLEKAKYIAGDANKDLVFKALDEAIARAAADAVVKLAQERTDAIAKIAKLEGDADKVKKDAEAAVKKATDDADALVKKTTDDADAAVKKVEKEAAAQKAMYEDRLANAAKEFVQRVAKSDALLKEGQYDAALKEYLAGVRTLKALPKENEDELERILAAHPALVKLDATAGNPSLGQKHYGDGLEFFRDNRFDRAEREFEQAVRFENKDARYRYYLGLSRWLQNKTEVAIEDYKAGAALEAIARPTSRIVNSSLQRIQGPSREALEKFRP